MEFDKEKLDRLVDSVIEKLRADTIISKTTIAPTQIVFQKNNPVLSKQGKFGVFENIDDAIKAAHIAQKKLILLPLKKRNEIIKNIRSRCRENISLLSDMAHRETGLGNIEDKKAKNHKINNQ